MPRGEETKYGLRWRRAGRRRFRRRRRRSPAAWREPAPGVGELATGLLAAGLGMLGEWIGATTRGVRRGVRRLAGHRHSRVDARRGRKS